MASSSLPMNKELKRIQMACTICRQKKLKCRPAADFPDGRCQRCVDCNGECIYLPVSSDPPLSPTHEPFSRPTAVDAHPAGYPANSYYHSPSPSYPSGPWHVQSGGHAQSGGPVIDPTLLVPQTVVALGPTAANFSHSYPQSHPSYDSYGGSQPHRASNGQTPSGLPATQYQYSSAWIPNYYGQPAQGSYPSGQVINPRGTAGPMQYTVHYGEDSTAPVWQGNPGHNQIYPRTNMDRNYHQSGESDGSSGSSGSPK